MLVSHQKTRKFEGSRKKQKRKEAIPVLHKIKFPSKNLQVSERKRLNFKQERLENEQYMLDNEQKGVYSEQEVLNSGN